MKAYKLFRVRKDGSLGSLFINASARLPLGMWMEAKEHPTKGFQFRPGWHCMARPEAPHLSINGRRWYEVEIEDYRTEVRCAKQGGKWYLARRMRIVGVADPAEIASGSAANQLQFDERVFSNGL